MKDWTKLGAVFCIFCSKRLEIGKDTAIAPSVTIIDDNDRMLNPEEHRYLRHTPHGYRDRCKKYSTSVPILMGENVLIGDKSRIQKGVAIGDNAIIASHSVVTNDVPANALAAGNHAKIVKTNIYMITTPTFPLE